MATSKQRFVTDEAFVKAYGYETTPPEQLTKEQQDNRNIMRTVINRYIGSLPADSLKKCALEGLWRCLKYHDYNQTKKKFTTNLWTFTDWECKRELRKLRKPEKAPRIVSMTDFKAVFDIPGKEMPEDVTHIRECIELLPPAQRDLIKEYFFDNRTMEEIGALHKYSKEAARQKINKALAKLREMFLGKVSAGVS